MTKFKIQTPAFLPLSVLIRNCLFGVVILLSFSLHAQPSPPANFNAQGYDSHVELSWTQNSEPNLTGYNVYRSEIGGDFELVKSISNLSSSYIDFIAEHDRDLIYKITAENTVGEESDFSVSAEASTFEMSDDELLTMVQAYTFRYFWDFAHPVSGMARERNTTSIVTSGGSGFGVMAILVGIKRGFITHEEGVERLLKIVVFLETADRFHGAFAHWMNGATGEVIPFSQFDNGGDLVETAFLMQGLLTVRQCISGENPNEIELRQKITSLWESVEWSWYRKGVQNVLFWHWSPNFGWQINHEIKGFNEAHIIYLLALASPTFSIPDNMYHVGWAGGNYTNSGTYFGYPLQVGPSRGGPLFFAHYSYLGFDPRYKKDEYANYFNNNVNHTLINREYCISNPKGYAGYTEDCWGLTASDDPFGYLAHEATPERDNGTLTPTAALSSMPYTPQLSIQALKHFYRVRGDKLWGKYGFYDAFNPDQNWTASSYLAIDQGPIICMIENYRSQLLWDCFMSNPEIDVAMDKIGFEADSTLATGLDKKVLKNIAVEIFPNPASDRINLILEVTQPGNEITIELLDNSGKSVGMEIHTSANNVGKYQFPIDIGHLTKGMYFVRVSEKHQSSVSKVLIMD